MDEVDHIVSFSFDRFHIGRRKLWAFTVFFFLGYYMLAPAQFGFLGELRDSLYICVVPVFVAAVLYFHEFQDGTEFKLLFAFWIWFWFSRALNGSPVLDHDFRNFFELSLMLPFFALGPALTKMEREGFLDWLSALIGGFYFVIGLLALVAFLRHSLYTLPFTDAQIGFSPETGYLNLMILQDNASITAFWYLIALSLMIYQFFHCEKKLWRVPVLLSAVLDLLVIAALNSRSVWLCAALTFALLAVMLLLKFLQRKSIFLRLAVVLAAATLVLIVSYKGCALCADAMNTLSYKISDSQRSPLEPAQQSAVAEGTVRSEACAFLRPMVLSSGRTEGSGALTLLRSDDQSDPPTASDNLNYVSFSRRQIWYGALQTIRTNPSILWRGHICDSVIMAAYGFIADDAAGEIPWNFYNSLIQVLMTTGLPGLTLVLSFLALVLVRALRLSLCVGAPLGIRILVLPVLATMPYFMLEAGLFSVIDIRTLFYFLMCGMTVASSREYA